MQYSFWILCLGSVIFWKISCFFLLIPNTRAGEQEPEPVGAGFFLAPWSRSQSRSKKNTRSRSRLGKNQEPEPFEKKVRSQSRYKISRLPSPAKDHKCTSFSFTMKQYPKNKQIMVKILRFNGLIFLNVLTWEIIKIPMSPPCYRRDSPSPPFASCLLCWFYLYVFYLF